MFTPESQPSNHNADNVSLFELYGISPEDQEIMELLEAEARRKRERAGMVDYKEDYEYENGLQLRFASKRVFPNSDFDVMGPPRFSENGELRPRGYVYMGPKLKWQIEGGEIESEHQIGADEFKTTFSGIQKAIGARKSTVRLVLADPTIQAEDLSNFLEHVRPKKPKVA